MIKENVHQVGSEWVPPEKIPDLSDAKEIAIDLETKDPGLKDLGPGWVRGDGYILGVAIAVDGWKGYFPLRHPGGGNFDVKFFNRVVAFQLWFSFLLEINNTGFILVNTNQIGNTPIVIAKMHARLYAPHFL